MHSSGMMTFTFALPMDDDEVKQMALVGVRMPPRHFVFVSLSKECSSDNQAAVRMEE